MAGADTGARQLDQTPTWAVALVCAVIVIISILLEKILHKVGQWFHSRHKEHLLEALEKIKGELMVLGFISLLLTFGQSYIADLCIPLKLADTWLPCDKKTKKGLSTAEHVSVRKDGPEIRGRLLWYEHRMLAGAASKGCKEGHVPLISINGLHQLHIFIFFLAVFHVFYGALTMMLGRLKIRGWKYWERETVNEFETVNDPARFRLTHETSFVKDHSSFWTKNAILFYMVCFFRQFFRSVRKTDYLTMRHGFISVHLAPGTKFDFQKYIKRSLEDDFKVVVGISPVLWTSAVISLLLNVKGLEAMFWLSILPLVVILALGTKLQAIIAQMAVEIQERHAVVQGIPLVQVSDRYFWFSRPKLVLHLIHLALFQNAFEITNFFWIWYEFGLHSCFHGAFTLQVVRVILGVAAQFFCSYSTLPLYALVTQMGSTMKKSIFDDQTSKALMQWHKNALKKKPHAKPSVPTRTLGGSSGDSPQNSPALHPKTNGEQSGLQMGNVNLSSSNQTANIVASVDVPEERHGPDDRKGPQSGNPDFLTGP